MQIDILAKNINLGDAFREYAKNKIESVTEKFFSDAIDVTVHVVKDNHNISVDITAHVIKGITLRSHQTAMDVYDAFNLALHRVETRLRRYHNRLKHHHEKAPNASTMRAMNYVLAHSPLNHEVHPHEEPEHPTVIAEMPGEIPSLSVPDAVMRMDLSDNNVFVFRNLKNGSINIVHRRSDGNIGWIDPQVSSEVHKL